MIELKSIEKTFDEYEKVNEKPTEELVCPICLMEFEKNDKIVELSCHALHVFHTTCIN